MTSDPHTIAVATGPTPDFAAHIERLRHLPRHPDIALRTFFARNASIFSARAPGRLDVMGGIADYSGSLVLEMPIAEAAFAAVQSSPDGCFTVATVGPGDSDAPRLVTIDAGEWSHFLQNDYSVVRRSFQNRPADSWAAYVVGPIITLLKEKHAQLRGGLRILIDSQVPEGKGVSSSAAIEVATLRAVAALLNLDLPGQELAQLCQLAENLVVGAPCGIMDQMTAAIGRNGELLALRCQPACVEGHAAVPAEIAFWGIDSGIRHAVSGSDYSSVRCGAFMGYRIIAEAAGLKAVPSRVAPGVFDIDDPKWHGYLANLKRAEFQSRYESLLPETISGRDFLVRYGGTTDRVTRVDPDQTYAVRAPTSHPIAENARVERFRSLLQAPITQQSLVELGQLMSASHAGYSACGLGSDGTDLLVRLVEETDATAGLFGAKITGGGSGGTVTVLGRANAGEAVEHVAKRYADLTGKSPYVFRGSSPGAYSTPVREVII